MSNDFLSLKWGILKGWKLETQKAKEAFAALEDAENASPGKTPKKEICDLIDAVNCKKIYLDWDDKFVSKKKAKEYVMDYPRD